MPNVGRLHDCELGIDFPIETLGSVEDKSRLECDEKVVRREIGKAIKNLFSIIFRIAVKSGVLEASIKLVSVVQISRKL